MNFNICLNFLVKLFFLSIFVLYSNCKSNSKSNEILIENSLQGTKEWWYELPTKIDDKSTYIHGFTTKFSYISSEIVEFKTNVNVSSIKIYRLGYYGGLGGRLIDTITNVSRVNQPFCLFDKTSKLVDCENWQVTSSWPISNDLVTGMYIALPFNDIFVKGTYMPFVIRRNISTILQSKFNFDILFKFSDLTWNAYNRFGSWNVYRGNGSFTFASRSFAASYNRPFFNRLPKPVGQHENFLFGSEYAMIRWLEKHGYDLSYASCWDVESYYDYDSANLSVIRKFNALLSIGHDEYWTNNLLKAFFTARNSGVHLLFLSGNEVFWKVRLESMNLIPVSNNTILNSVSMSLISSSRYENSRNTEPRLMICRKETIGDLPHVFNDTKHFTGTFMDPRPFIHQKYLFTPPNSLTGQLFHVNGFQNDSIHVSYGDSRLRFWRNSPNVSNLTSDKYGYTSSIGLLGYEFDIFVDDCFRPHGLIGLSTTHRYISNGLLETYGASYKGSGRVLHRITMYRYIPSLYSPHKSKLRNEKTSIVFSTGTIQWAWALSNFHDGYIMPVDKNIIQATLNILADMNIFPLVIQDKVLTYPSSSKDSIPPFSNITYPKNNEIFTFYCSNSKKSQTRVIEISGHAEDIGGGYVAGVEVSVDNGTSWILVRRHLGFERWSFTLSIHINHNSRLKFHEIKNCSISNSLTDMISYSNNSILRHQFGNNKMHHLFIDGSKELTITSRAFDDSGWIEGCCGESDRIANSITILFEYENCKDNY